MDLENIHGLTRMTVRGNEGCQDGAKVCQRDGSPDTPWCQGGVKGTVLLTGVKGTVLLATYTP